MSIEVFSHFPDGLQTALAVKKVLLTWPGRSAPLGVFIAMPIVAIAWLALQSRRSLRTYKYRRILNVLFQRSFFKHKSHSLDVIYTVANCFVFPALLAWAFLSASAVSGMTTIAFNELFGTRAPSILPPVVVGAIWAVTVYLAYEVAYWFDHILSHKVPLLWEFHKVHHAAESLSPLTNFRVHPVNSIVYYNIQAVITGATIGVLKFAFGANPIEAGVFTHANITLVTIYLLSHLHHSQIWIPFTGIWGKLFMSPAHHQIHHSSDPRHHDKNMGNTLAIFDWLTGTLYVPTQQREKLTFGLDTSDHKSHTLSESLAAPVHAVGRRLANAVIAAQPTVSHNRFP